MSGRDDGILDLLALPALGSEMLAARPSLLFSADGRRILFGNPAGGAFLGAPSLMRLRERRFAPELPSTGQIARAARSLSAGGSRLERIRFPGSAGFSGIAAECRRLSLPDGEAVLLIRLPAPRSIPDPTEAARRLVAFLTGAGRAVALIDAEGRVLAEEAGAGMKRAGGSFPVIAAAASATAPVHRMLTIGSERRPATLLALGEGAEAPVLVLLEEAAAPAPLAPAPEPEPETAHQAAEPVASAAVELAAENTAELEASVEPEPPAIIEHVPAALPASPVAEAEQAIEPAIESEAPAAATIAEAVDANAPTETGSEPAEATVLAAEDVSADATPSEPLAPADEADAEPEDEPAPSQSAQAGFQFVEPKAPVRFVFQMDAEGRFTFVSPNFAEWIGPAAAIAVGERWGEMASRLGLDPAGAVASLIARRDTWSGVTLDWPVEGSDRFVAVDLAALPAFSRERVFEGYRGFGVIRSSERRQPQERALPPKVAAEPQPSPTKPPLSIAERVSGGNVIRLPLPQSEGERLSPPEQDAFRRIAAALTTPTAPGSDPIATNAEQPPAKPPVEAEPLGPSSPAEPAQPLSTEAAEAELPPAPELPEPVETPDASFAAGEAEVEPVVTEEMKQPEVADETDAGEDAAQTNDAPEEVAPEDIVAIVAAPEPSVAERSAGLAELAAARQRIVELEAILDTATDGILVIDEEGHIERLNRSAEALFGVEAQSVAGHRITELLAEESRQSALDYLDGLTRNGVASVLNDGREVIGRVPQGGLIPLFMTMGRLPETGKFCAVLRDITQWKNAEGELINAKRAAESASMQKSDFLAKVSHEIRTPLNAIIGFSEVMMEERFGPIGTERYKEYLRDIHVSGAHLMSLLNDLLDLSKIEAGKMDLNFESVALNDIVMECVALMQPQANRERIIIRTSLSGQVPNVVADPRSIRQIVLNLVSNAVKFTLAGGQVIVSTAMEPHGEVTLRIRDTGIGMSSSDIETALKPFRQLSASRERRSDGTGLGLPLTKALVEANRASFAIDSAVGQGTLIRITFPATRVLAG